MRKSAPIIQVIRSIKKMIKKKEKKMIWLDVSVQYESIRMDHLIDA